MSVFLVSAGQCTVVVKADEFVVRDDGYLLLLDDDAGVPVAAFAPGSWQSVVQQDQPEKGG